MPSLFSVERGSGPDTLIFLHGFCETHKIWEEFVKPLEKTFRVLIPDLPGFGNSAMLASPFTIDDVANEVSKWIMTKTPDRPAIVIGHSLGGYISLSLASHHSGLLRGFGLFHSTAFADSEEKKVNRNKIIDFVERNGVIPFVDTFVPGLFFDKKHPSIPFVHSIASLTPKETLIGYSVAMRDRFDQASVLLNGSLPNILIAGAEDVLVPPEVSQKMAKLGASTSYHELQKVAHMGIFEAKNECQTILQAWSKQIIFQ